MFCKGSGASSSHGLTRDITVEEVAKTRDEEVTRGDAAGRCEPKRRGERKSRVSRNEIFGEANKRIDVRVLFLSDNDAVALKKLICFVAGQMKFILIRRENNGRPFCDFLPIAEFFGVGESEFS